MTQYVLTLLEATGIQDYIFGSNHLAQNIGASELTYRATTEWVVKTLDELSLSHNSSWQEDKGMIYSAATLVDNELQAEVVYAGGGNAMLLFANDDDADCFGRALTRRVLTEARGLQLVAIRERFYWEKDILANVHTKLRGKLAARKFNYPVSAPLPGLSVTQACVFTGLPAIGLETDPAIVGEEAAQKARRIGGEARAVSAEVAAKLRAEHLGKNRLKQLLPQVGCENYDFVYDFDEFGTKGESSYLAVIHTDGNRMGKRFEAIVEKHQSSDLNGAYVQKLRKASNSVQAQAQKALQETIAYLFASRDQEAKFGNTVPTPIRKGDHKPLLPFRPIVFGGDDVTFVCEGRLGLALAAKYLQSFTAAPLWDDKPAKARAGVAIVKSHYPFSRAYQLADDLAKTAKEAIDTFKQHNEDSATVVDWHISTSGVILPLNETRKREYSAKTGKSLLMRPICLGPIPDQWRTWGTFTNLMKAFQEEEGEDGGSTLWSGQRNKLKALRDALRDGRSEAVELFRANYRLKDLPDIPGQPDMCSTGWQGDECGYFDALEALDFFVSLEV